MGSQAVLGTVKLPGRGYGAAPPVRADSPPRRALSGRIGVLRSLGAIFQSLPVGTWVLWDLALLYIGTYFGFKLFVTGWILPYLHVQMWQAWGILAGTFLFASLVFGLYERETLYSRSRILTRMMLTTVTAAVITYAIVYALLYTTLSRRVTGMSIGLLVACGGSARLFARWALNSTPRGLLIVGPGMVSNSLIRAFKKGFLSEYRLAGYVDDTVHSPAIIDGLPRVGGTAELPDICRRHCIQDIVVGAEAAMDPHIMNAVLPCLSRGCRVTNEATFYEKATGQILVDEITPHWFLFADLQVHCQRRQALKRAFDIVMALAGILAALPLLPIIALLIKLDDWGPAFYVQERVGQNGKAFTLYKFRTMRVGAETTTPIWAVKNDARATRVGRLLRKTRLDELPQFYNVLMGHMSLVGPRPERPDFVARLSEEIPYFNERHLVKPGLTGWAQIGFRYGSSIEDAKRKLQFDLYYVKNMSIELDLMILLRTLGVFLRGAC